MRVKSVNVHLVHVTSCLSLHGLITGLQVARDRLVLEMRCHVTQLEVVLVVAVAAAIVVLIPVAVVIIVAVVRVFESKLIGCPHRLPVAILPAH